MSPFGIGPEAGVASLRLSCIFCSHFGFASPPVSALGHEERFPSPSQSARCRFIQGTFAGTRGNGRDARIAAVGPLATYGTG
jgi:hypothetical protein